MGSGLPKDPPLLRSEGWSAPRVYTVMCMCQVDSQLIVPAHMSFGDFQSKFIFPIIIIFNFVTCTLMRGLKGQTYFLRFYYVGRRENTRAPPNIKKLMARETS